MTRKIRFLAGAGVATLALSVLMVPSASAAEGEVLSLNAPEKISGSFIVKLKEGKANGHALASRFGGTVEREYKTFGGFNVKLTEKQAKRLAADPSVEFVEADQVVHTQATQTNPPSWGLDRIDQRNLPLSNSFTYTRTGQGVHAYIIDTGITPSHPDFGGRATFDFNSIDSNNTDCMGHGTHVAGTVGSTTYGVAKAVRLHGVKWLDCGGNGTAESAIAAVDWVTKNAVKPAVANASWNWAANTTLKTALTNMINSGVFLAASAGNTGGNSCDRLPRGVETALVVAASEKNDARASYSSTGACVDVYAPGSAIVSTLRTGGSGAMNGTSMATPHVTGVAALYLQTSPSATPATVKSYIETNATPNKVINGGTGGTVNRLLFSNGL
jgi:subtilisin family serine protease